MRLPAHARLLALALVLSSVLASAFPTAAKPAILGGNRKLLSQQNIQSVQTAQVAQLTASASTTDTATTAQKDQQFWDDHFGGSMAYPPPGAPVYYPPEYVPHGDHFDYVAGHYHNGRKLMTAQSASSATTLKSTQSTAAATNTEAAQSTTKATTTQKDQQFWDDHFGGSVAYPPPGAPVYYPPEYVPHGDHFDYVAGHYHNGRKLQAAKPTSTVPSTAETKASTTTAKQAAVTSLSDSNQQDQQGQLATIGAGSWNSGPSPIQYNEGQRGAWPAGK